jgi:hypothetical protein
MMQGQRGAAAFGRRNKKIGAAIAAVLMVTGLVAVAAGAQGGAGAATPSGIFTVYTYGSPVVAGGTYYVNGTGCLSSTGATAVLISLDTPSGSSISGSVATPYGSQNGSYAGQWYGEVTVPTTALPSTDYTVTASCRGQGQIFAYAPVTLDVTAATATAITITPDALSPGSSTTVSGQNCQTPAGFTGPVSVEVSLVNNESVPVDLAAVAPKSDGTWSAVITVPADSSPGTYLIAANCDQYSTGVNYVPQSLSVQAPPVVVATTVATYRGATSAASGTQVTLSAAVKSSGTPVAGVPVTLKLGSNAVVAFTNINGVARGLATAPAAGSTTVSASFAGTSGFAASSTGNVPFTVTGTQSATKLAYNGAVTADEYSPVSLSAKLTGPGSVAVVGRAVTFAIPYGYLQGAITNASGVAAISVQLDEPGTNLVGIDYDGNSDPTYASSTKSAKVTVGPLFTPAAIACASASKCTIVGSNGESRYSSNGGQTWVPVTPVTTESLSSVACPSATGCIAVGASGTVLTSANAGASWSVVPAISTQSLSVVKCDGTALCVTVGAAGVVFTSTTSGATWSPGTSGTTLNFDALACPTTTTCLATANAAGSSATLVSTTSGSTWSTVSGSEPGGPVTGQDQLVCTSATTCLTSSSTAGIYRTVDQGQIWTATDGTYDSTLWCKSAKSCLSLSAYGDVGTSTNGGVSWTYTYPFTPYGTAQDMTCVSKVCIGVFRSSYSDATTYVSSDGGVTWSGPGGL